MFVERYDYLDRHGFIERYTLGADGRLNEVRTALRECWHLSYPRVFEAEGGAPYSLPDCAGVHRDGMHTLLACRDWTLLDVKRVDRSGRGVLYDLMRLIRPSG